MYSSTVIFKVVMGLLVLMIGRHHLLRMHRMLHVPRLLMQKMGLMLLLLAKDLLLEMLYVRLLLLDHAFSVKLHAPHPLDSFIPLDTFLFSSL